MTTSIKNPLTVKEWHQCEHKLDIWKDFLTKKTISMSFMMEYWFYWVAYFMEQKVVAVAKALESVRTLDDRYQDQVQQIMCYVQDLLRKCRCVLTQNTQHLCREDKFPCRSYQDRFRCFHGLRTQWFNTGMMRICQDAKDAVMEDVDDLLRIFLTQWLSDLYYVWKLCMDKRIKFPLWVGISNIQLLPLDDIHLWEVVCEDDEKQILSHPLLPHPRDFLEKRVVVKDSNLYAHKARFEYQIPGTLSQYPVFLSKKASIIPKMAPGSLYQEERVECEWKQCIVHQSNYSETTTAHKNGRQYKKRRLSKILKEGRKKNKTQRIRRRRAENSLRQSFPVEDNEDYYGGVYDDYEYYFTNWETTVD